MRRAWVAAVAVLGLALMLAPLSPSSATVQVGVEQVGRVLGLRDASSGAQSPTPSASSRPDYDWARVEPGDAVPGWAIRQRFGREGTPPAIPERRLRGARIVVPMLHAVLPIRRSRVAGGAMAVPSTVNAVGWLDSSRHLGAPRGVSVLATHRDTGGGGRGVRSPLAGLARLPHGSVITVVGLDGHSHRYRVVSATGHDADNLPAALARSTGPGTLAVLTCGGRRALDEDGALQWSKRIIVWARLLR